MTRQDAILRTLADSRYSPISGIQRVTDDGLTHHLLTSGAVTIDSTSPILADIPESLRYVKRKTKPEALLPLVAKIRNAVDEARRYAKLPPATFFERLAIDTYRENKMTSGVLINDHAFRSEYVARALRICGSGNAAFTGYRYASPLVVMSKDFETTVLVMPLNRAVSLDKYVISDISGEIVKSVLDGETIPT